VEDDIKFKNLLWENDKYIQQLNKTITSLTIREIIVIYPTETNMSEES